MHVKSYINLPGIARTGWARPRFGLFYVLTLTEPFLQLVSISTEKVDGILNFSTCVTIKQMCVRARGGAERGAAKPKYQPKPSHELQRGIL